MRRLSVVMIGIAFGAATAASDTVAGGLHQSPWDRALGMLLNAGFVWAGLAVLAGWMLGRSRTEVGAVAGFLALACAVGGYYTYGVTVGDRSGLGLGALSGVIRLWLVAAVVAGPLLGIAGAWTRRGDVLGVLARLVVPVGALVEMLVVRHLGAGTFRVDPALAWTQLLVVSVAALGAAWAVVRPAGARFRAALR